MVKLFLFVSIIAVAPGCKTNNPTEQTARKYCSSCHLFPEASLLDRDTWKKHVLPAMGRLMGVIHVGNNPFEESDSRFEKQRASIPDKDWQAVVAYYLTEAPKHAAPQSRPVVKNFTDHFVVKQPLPIGGAATNTFIKIDPGNQWIYAASRSDSSLYIYDHQLKLIGKEQVHAVLTDMFFDSAIIKPGPRNGILTNIGIMDPNDFKTGSVDLFHLTNAGKFGNTSKLFDTLQRPVQSLMADLNMDGKMDYIICGFGNTQGAFYWMKNKGNGGFEQQMLRPQPGAIKAYVDDCNQDGLPDIVALFAQAREEICLFVNKGNGNFEMEKLIEFPPVYGSSYVELCDMNGDGHKDILYTCGDNADYSYQSLKNYQGIYIFLNNGHFRFKQQYFFPMHGAYKAMARDFDKDGDMDIAAISFFPDREQQPQESFVYLENKGHFKFASFTIKEFNEGHWITMDAGDVDNDGDDDIVIGSLFLPYETLDDEAAFSKKPFFLLLENQTIK